MKKNKLKSIFAACALLSGTAMAEDSNKNDSIFNPLDDNISIQINIASYHIQAREYNDWNGGGKKTFNEKNSGIGIAYDFANIFNDKAKLFASIGGYDNSFYEKTFYGGIGIETIESKLLGDKIDFGSELLLTHGYRSPDGTKPNVVPIPHIFVDVEVAKDFSVRVGLIPSSLGRAVGIIDKNRAVDVVTLSTSLKL